MNAGEFQNSGMIKVCPVSFVLESRGVLVYKWRSTEYGIAECSRRYGDTREFVTSFQVSHRYSSVDAMLQVQVWSTRRTVLKCVNQYEMSSAQADMIILQYCSVDTT